MLLCCILVGARMEGWTSFNSGEKVIANPNLLKEEEVEEEEEAGRLWRHSKSL